VGVTRDRWVLWCWVLSTVGLLAILGGAVGESILYGSSAGWEATLPPRNRYTSARKHRTSTGLRINQGQDTDSTEGEKTKNRGSSLRGFVLESRRPSTKKVHQKGQKRAKQDTRLTSRRGRDATKKLGQKKGLQGPGPAGEAQSCQCWVPSPRGSGGCRRISP